MAELGAYYITIMPSMKGFSSAVNKELGDLGNSGGKNFSNSFGDVLKGSAIGTTLGNLASKAGDAIVGGLSTGIARFDTMQNFPKVMQAFGYSADEASKSIKLVQEHLRGLPTASDEVVALTQSISDSTPNLDMATRAALGFNDMMLAGGASTSEMANATGILNRILGKGSATIQQWQSLQSVMPKQLDQVSEAMLGAGASSMDLYEALESGQVSYQDFLAAIIKLDEEGSNGMASFYDQAKAASIGIDSAIRNITTRIGAGWARIMEVIGQKEIHDVLEGIADGFENAFKAVAGVLQNLKNQFADLGTFEKFQTVIGMVQEKFGQFGETVKGAVDQAIPVIANLIDKGLQWLIDHGESIGHFVDTIAGAFGKVAEVVGGALSGAMPVLGNLIDKVLTWILDHGELVVTLLGAIAAKMAFEKAAGAAEAIGGVAKGLGALGGALPKVKTLGDIPGMFKLAAEAGGPLEGLFSSLGGTAGAAGGSISGLGGVLSGVAVGPFVAVVAAVVAATAAFKTLWDTNEGFRNTVQGIWDGVVSKIQEAGNKIGEALKPVAEALGLKDAGEGIEVVIAVLGKLWEVVANIFGPQLVNLISSAAEVIKGIVDIVTGVFQVIGGIVKGFQTGDWSLFMEGLKSIWDGFWGVVLAPVNGAIEAIKYTLEQMGYKWEEIVAYWKGVWDGFIGFFKGLWDGAVEKVTEFCNNVSSTWEGIKSTAQTTWENISGTVKGALDDAKTVGESTVNTFTAALNGDWTTAAENAKTAFDTIDKNITGALQSAKDSGIPIVSDLASGALEKWEWLKTEGGTKFADLARSISDNLGNAKQWAEEKGREIQEFWESIPDKIIGFFTGIGDRISEAFGNIHFPAPHVTWDSISIGDWTVPLPNVQWYAKGGVFDAATLIGVGEAGREAALPLNAKTYGEIARGINGEMGSDVADEIRALRDDVQRLQLVVQLDSGAIAGGVYPYIDSRMETQRRREARRR